jgi:hypothetical protein
MPPKRGKKIVANRRKTDEIAAKESEKQVLSDIPDEKKNNTACGTNSEKALIFL